MKVVWKIPRSIQSAASCRVVCLIGIRESPTTPTERQTTILSPTDDHGDLGEERNDSVRCQSPYRESGHCSWWSLHLR
jgi:hypothetical protein